jgi:hypothetical protein
LLAPLLELTPESSPPGSHKVVLLKHGTVSDLWHSVPYEAESSCSLIASWIFVEPNLDSNEAVDG